MESRVPVPHRNRIPIGFAGAIVAFAALFVALVLSAFHEPRPSALPVGIVAPPAVAARVQASLDAGDPGGIDLLPYRGRAAARSAIVKRQIDGALVVEPHQMELFTAEAGGTAPAATLTGVFDAVAASSRVGLTVTDVVPPLGRDSAGLSSFFIILAVLFPSLAAGAATAHVLRRHHPVWRLAAPIVMAAAIGPVVAAVADAITGFGHYPALAGIVALFSLAVAAPTAALGRIALPFIGIAVAAFMILGLPVSGGPAGLAAFGPGFLRWLDAALPLGIAATVVRNTVYFHGNDITAHLWVLGAWATSGLVALAALGRHDLATNRRVNRGGLDLAGRGKDPGAASSSRPAA